jgi:hypothetical protein
MIRTITTKFSRLPAAAQLDGGAAGLDEALTELFIFITLLMAGRRTW